MLAATEAGKARMRWKVSIKGQGGALLQRNCHFALHGHDGSVSLKEKSGLNILGWASPMGLGSAILFILL